MKADRQGRLVFPTMESFDTHDIFFGRAIDTVGALLPKFCIVCPPSPRILYETTCYLVLGERERRYGK
jgi:hypothetical protein